MHHTLLSVALVLTFAWLALGEHADTTDADFVATAECDGLVRAAWVVVGASVVPLYYLAGLKEVHCLLSQDVKEAFFQHVIECSAVTATAAFRARHPARGPCLRSALRGLSCILEYSVYAEGPVAITLGYHRPTMIEYVDTVASDAFCSEADDGCLQRRATELLAFVSEQTQLWIDPYTPGAVRMQSLAGGHDASPLPVANATLPVSADASPIGSGPGPGPMLLGLLVALGTAGCLCRGHLRQSRRAATPGPPATGSAASQQGLSEEDLELRRRTLEQELRADAAERKLGAMRDRYESKDLGTLTDDELAQRRTEFDALREALALEAAKRQVKRETATSCCICRDAVADHAFAPCHHKCVCASCALKPELRACPICRVDIVSRFRVFDS